MDPLEILRKQFGYDSFRLEQEAIISAVLKRKDTLVIMPTGGGKSLCYQIPALMLEGITLVISPLIALMKDQVDALRLNGIGAACLNSTQTHREQEAILVNVKENKVKLLYMAPERLMSGDRPSSFLETLRSFNISLVAIDEAHCISHWGHDFRPEYRMLSHLKKSLPGVPFIALTATADGLTRKDIVEKLALASPQIFISSFNRANIRYTVEPKKDSMERLHNFLDTRREQSGIIYCLSRRSTEALAEELTLRGHTALPYHAGMDRDVRAKNQELFQNDIARIIVATVAFGMGIDKSNVRYVVHMDLPKNIESYYQETGRAGRDGLESEALLFYSAGDVVKLKKFAVIENNPEQTKILLRKLDEMGRFGALRTCRRQYLLNYFNENAPRYCGNCDVCLMDYELYDGTSLAKKVIEAVGTAEEKFGAGYIIDLLRGSASARIREAHRTSPAFGAGADVPRAEWELIIQDLIARNYLLKTGGIYPVLQLAEPLHQGAEKVMLSRPKATTASRARQTADAIGYDQPLFELLKGLRTRLARKENVPPYLVLTDATLIEMSTYLPRTIEAFSQMSGIGRVKLEKYAAHFLSAVNEYCRDHNLSTRINLRLAGGTPAGRSFRDSDTRQHTLRLFREGYPVADIASQRSLAQGTIEGHLAFYIQKGTIAIEQVMAPGKIDVIRRALRSMGAENLTPLKLSLGDGYSYGDIRCVMAHMARNDAEEPAAEYTAGDVLAA